MMIKHKGVLPVLEKMCKNAPAAKCFGVKHLDDLGLYISPKMDILFMIYAADALVKTKHKPSPFHANSIYRHARALLNERYLCHLQHEKEKLPTLDFSQDTTIQQTKILSHSNMSLLISTMRSLDYNAMNS